MNGELPANDPEIKQLIFAHKKIKKAILDNEIKALVSYKHQFALYRYIPYSIENNLTSFYWFIEQYPVSDIEYRNEYKLVINFCLLNGKFDLLNKLNKKFHILDEFVNSLNISMIIRAADHKIELIDFLLAHNFNEKLILNTILYSEDVIEPEILSKLYWRYKNEFHSINRYPSHISTFNMNIVLNQCFLIDQGVKYIGGWDPHEYYPILDVMRVVSTYNNSKIFSIIHLGRYEKLRQQFACILDKFVKCQDLIELILDYV